MLLRMMSMLGFCGNAVDIIGETSGTEICEQLLHFSRAVSERLGEDYGGYESNSRHDHHRRPERVARAGRRGPITHRSRAVG
jgi:hypothetical protein